jgi:hypothetical protein
LSNRTVSAFSVSKSFLLRSLHINRNKHQGPTTGTLSLTNPRTLHE